MSEVFENEYLNQGLPKQSAESPRHTMRDDNSSDSDLDESRSSVSFRSEDMSDVSRDSIQKKDNMYDGIRSIKSIKVINQDLPPRWIENDPKMLQVTDQDMLAKNIQLPVMSRGMSKRDSQIHGQGFSSKLTGEKSSEGRRFWWADSLNEVVLKVAYSQLSAGDFP